MTDTLIIAMTVRRGALLLAAAAAVVAAATPAYAGYSVQTDANTGRGYARGCAATYNVIGAGAAFITEDGRSAPCSSPSHFNGQTVTVTGSTDTTGKLRASHDESSVVADNAAYGVANATAAADLKTGQVHLTASSSYSAGDTGAGATASARLSDTLHFKIAGASANTVTLVPVRFAFDGKLYDGADPRHSSAALHWDFSFGNASAAEFGDYGAGLYSPPQYPAFVFPEATPSRVSGWQSYQFASYKPTDTRFTGIYAITGATADIPISFGLRIDAANLTLDYAHTGSVGIDHVAGVSFTSDSGVFLTGSAGGVPEPAAWALMLTGFAAVGAAARRRRLVVAA